MAKEMFSNRIDADLIDALRAEARGESRSVANMLEVVLRERYARRGSDPVGPASVGGNGSSSRVAAAVPSKCDHPTHGRSGWRCKGCGVMF